VSAPHINVIMYITTPPTVNHLSGEKARQQLSVTVMSVWDQERRICQIVIEHKRISIIYYYCYY